MRMMKEFSLLAILTLGFAPLAMAQVVSEGTVFDSDGNEVVGQLEVG